MPRILRRMLLMDQHTCPWWLAYSWDHRLRKLIHDPNKIIKPLVRPGDTLLDLGCGMGYFSIAMAELTGEGGTVYAVDIQQKMLDILVKRVKNKSIEKIINPVLVAGNSDPGDKIAAGSIDLILSFWMLHEVEDKQNFLDTWLARLKTNGLYFLVEPKIHTSEQLFSEEIRICSQFGLELIDHPKVGISRTALFRKQY